MTLFKTLGGALRPEQIEQVQSKIERQKYIKSINELLSTMSVNGLFRVQNHIINNKIK